MGRVICPHCNGVAGPAERLSFGEYVWCCTACGWRGLVDQFEWEEYNLIAGTVERWQPEPGTDPEEYGFEAEAPRPGVSQATEGEEL